MRYGRNTPREWLLIGYEELDDELNITKGEALAHSPRKEEIYRHLLSLRGKGESTAGESSGRWGGRRSCRADIHPRLYLHGHLVPLSQKGW